MSDKPFTVSDRRHFTADGQPREDPPASEPGRSAAEGTASPGGLPAGGPPPEADFTSLVVSLATQASLLLGGHGLPEGAAPGEGLAGARSLISILEMLQEKTEGRRTPAESAVLENLLYELRMAYVAAAKGAGA
ncbi:MAG TPA: DUF1844 domain-containing protein [Vicinamibacteria bacterium]|nr:DUF1844 domain-containing protein [Vicinamibacteria bacterium]